MHMAPEDQSRECAQTSLIPTRALCSPGMKSVPGSFPCFHHHHRSVQTDTRASSEQEGFAEAPRSHPGTQGFSFYRREALWRSKILHSSYKYLKQKFLFIVPVCRGRCFLGVSLPCGSTLQPASTSAAELGLREAHEGQVLWAAAALRGSPDATAAPLRANPEGKGTAAPKPALPAVQYPQELRAPRRGNRQQCEGRVEKQEGSHRSRGVRQSPVRGLRGALGFQASSSFLQAVSKAAAVAILVPGRVWSSGYFAEETPRRCGGC